MSIQQHLDNTPHYLEVPNSLVIDKSWSQGRTVYGGISTAIAYQAMELNVDPAYTIKNLNVNFVGPLFADSPCSIEVMPLRIGKNVAQLIAFIKQNDKHCVVVQGCFVKDRESKIVVDNRPPLHFGKSKSKTTIPPIPKVVPKFLKHIDLTFEGGGIPFTGRKTSHYQGWFKFKDYKGSLSTAAFIGLLDAFPPTLIQMLKWPAPASSINWNLEVLHPLPVIDGNDWLAYEDLTIDAHSGYGATEAKIWTKEGQLLALSRQTVAVFD